MTLDLARLDPRARFALLLVPRLLTRRSTPTRLAGYAFELNARGSRRLGEWCWRRAVRAAADLDEHVCGALIELCIRANRHDAAEQLVSAYFERSGMAPTVGLELAGRLAADGRHDAAHRVFKRMLDLGREVVAERQWPAPAWTDPPRPFEISAGLARCDSLDEEHRALLERELARLCFGFRAFGACAELFARAQRRAPLGREERIAYQYAVSQSSDRVRLEPVTSERLRALAPAQDSAAADCGSDDVDWQLLRAAVLAMAGDAPAAVSAAESGIRRVFAEHADLAPITGDCRAMLHAIARFGELTFDGAAAASAAAAGPGATAGPAAVADPAAAASPAAVAGPPKDRQEATRKLFICGHGWSGSGALYDALLEFDGLHRMPMTPIDRFVNACTDDEMTFVQGPGGLGMIWRKARDEGRLQRSDLLDLFRFHVLGGGAIGHSEHKCAKNARHLLATFGSGYSSAFRRMIEAIAALPPNAPLTELKAILEETAESLTCLLARCRAADCVVLNNTVFGHNVDMLEIFRSFRAAVVVRDPLDQYADRRAQDVKHWMNAGRFVRFYRETRLAFAGGRAKLSAGKAGDVRDVEFERFVRDEAYRKEVLGWLLKGVDVQHAERRFEPERSAQNIGIHRRLLAEAERGLIEQGLSRWRRS